MVEIEKRIKIKQQNYIQLHSTDKGQRDGSAVRCQPWWYEFAIPGHTWWKWRTNSCKLTSGLHVCTMACVCHPSFSQINIISNYRSTTGIDKWIQQTFLHVNLKSKNKSYLGVMDSVWAINVRCVCDFVSLSCLCLHSEVNHRVIRVITHLDKNLGRINYDPQVQTAWSRWAALKQRLEEGWRWARPHEVVAESL